MQANKVNYTFQCKALLRNKFYYQSYIKSFTLELLADFLGRLRILWLGKFLDYRAVKNYNECKK